jgi:hypothetical protein
MACGSSPYEKNGPNSKAIHCFPDRFSVSERLGGSGWLDSVTELLIGGGGRTLDLELLVLYGAEVIPLAVS